MGDVIAADFKAKKNLGKLEHKSDFEQIIDVMFGAAKSIDDIPWPGMDSANYVAPEKDPA